MSIGFFQLLIVILVILLVFGKMPHIISDIAKGFKSLRDSLDMEEKKNRDTNVSGIGNDIKKIKDK
uniref:Sec-independent protein translocase component tatA/E n=1 Tax=Jakoba bahamiensis TaxID=221721 RepID=M4QKX8_9EUKA|nr:Sec-independent protein translocase component tatA/E [Jakoba bahamiensis]AGH24113.1 Sec-independent protein translocase component tatA/E [Jakoba bahamiensis]